jgi:hypothetical protein
MEFANIFWRILYAGEGDYEYGYKEVLWDSYGDVKVPVLKDSNVNIPIDSEFSAIKKVTEIEETENALLGVFSSYTLRETLLKMDEIATPYDEKIINTSQLIDSKFSRQIPTFIVMNDKFVTKFTEIDNQFGEFIIYDNEIEGVANCFGELVFGGVCIYLYKTTLIDGIIVATARDGRPVKDDPGLLKMVYNYPEYNIVGKNMTILVKYNIFNIDGNINYISINI